MDYQSMSHDRTPLSPSMLIPLFRLFPSRGRYLFMQRELVWCERQPAMQPMPLQFIQHWDGTIDLSVQRGVQWNDRKYPLRSVSELVQHVRRQYLLLQLPLVLVRIVIGAIFMPVRRRRIQRHGTASVRRSSTGYRRQSV
jgi:hypothetical protein